MHRHDAENSVFSKQHEYVNGEYREVKDFKPFQYPKYKYSMQEGKVVSRIAVDPKAEDALGAGWYDSPNDAKKPPVKPPATATVKT